MLLDYGLYISHRKYVRIYDREPGIEPTIKDDYALSPDLHADCAQISAQLKDYSTQLRHILGNTLPQDEVTWHCIYCCGPLSLVDKYGQSAYDTVKGEFRPHVWNIVRKCSICGWWIHSHWHGRKDLEFRRTFQSITTSEALLRTFYEQDDASIHELTRYLRQFGRAAIRPVHLEKLIQSVFRVQYPQANVLRLGGTADTDCDLFLSFLSADKNALIQVCRNASGDLGANVKVMKDLLGIMFLEGRWQGIVVTVAKQASLEEEEIARVRLRANVLRRYIEMDPHVCDQLIEALGLQVEQPWKELNTLDYPRNPLD